MFGDLVSRGYQYLARIEITDAIPYQKIYLTNNSKPYLNPVFLPPLKKQQFFNHNEWFFDVQWMRLSQMCIFE